MIALAAGLLQAALPLSAAEQVPATARALHERILVLDSHLDTPMLFDDPQWNILERHAPGDGTQQVDLPRMIEGGLDGGLWVIYTPQRGRSAADNQVARGLV
jgi:membrane dipeptidase